MGKILIIIGALLVLAGILVLLGVPIGRLPGDISYKGERFSFYFPIVTSILVSVILSILFYLFAK